MTLVEPKTIARSEGKAKRVIDKKAYIDLKSSSVNSKIIKGGTYAYKQLSVFIENRKVGLRKLQLLMDNINIASFRLANHRATVY